MCCRLPPIHVQGSVVLLIANFFALPTGCNRRLAARLLWQPPPPAAAASTTPLSAIHSLPRLLPKHLANNLPAALSLGTSSPPCTTATSLCPRQSSSSARFTATCQLHPSLPRKHSLTTTLARSTHRPPALQLLFRFLSGGPLFTINSTSGAPNAHCLRYALLTANVSDPRTVHVLSVC